MIELKPGIVAGVIISTALTAALAFESVYDISVRPRGADPLASPTNAADAWTGPTPPPLPLRLVDSGGVGIPWSGEWGTDYSHARRVFHDVILTEPPYVDEAAFRRVERDWHAYVDRMLEYGNNSITVPLLLELIDFDRVQLPKGSAWPVPIYVPESPFRARHAAVRRWFGPLFEWTDRRGMQVFLDADMLTLTPPLSRLLRSVAPDTGELGIDTSNPAVWEVYRHGLEELFDALPTISGVVLRFGEGGSLYNTKGWPYQSEMAVRSEKSLQMMLRGLLPVFETRHKILVLRSWTVGVGRLGRLHVDPHVYDAVLGGIDSPALVVSTKFTAGDFFSYLPLNPTLASGRHRRIIELQAKPEFEGFGAFPDFLGADYARALRALRSANPQIVGTYVLSQFGGPLRAGPRILYPLKGFWLWLDANVFVASRLAVDPTADVDQLTRLWARARFGNDLRIVDAIVSVLRQTREAVLEGFYIRAFAERDVRVPGLELPPLMWIFEWDMVGGWHSLLSIIYRASRDDLDMAIEEGYAAAAAVREARQKLQTAVAIAPADACPDICDTALRSLEYQESLFDALAAWRQTFLSYYRWLDTGDLNAWSKWRAGRVQFENAATRHTSRFGSDLDFPAFDLTSARRAVITAERGALSRVLAAAIAIGVLALLYIGSSFASRGSVLRKPGALAKVACLMWTAALTPWRLGREPVNFRSALAVTTLTLTMLALLVGVLTGFANVGMAAASCLPAGAAALTFESTAMGGAPRDGRGRLFVAAVGPLIPAVVLLFGLIAYLGPVGFWYSFWLSPIFRVVFLTILVATLPWTVYVMLAARSVERWHGPIGGLLAALGAGLVALTMLLPDWVDVLRWLDRPLNLAPATETMLFALRTYAGVKLDIGGTFSALGALLLAVGYSLRLRSTRRARTMATPLDRV
jgi:hypothetical protein